MVASRSSGYPSHSTAVVWKWMIDSVLNTEPMVPQSGQKRSVGGVGGTLRTDGGMTMSRGSSSQVPYFRTVFVYGSVDIQMRIWIESLLTE